MLTPSYLRQKFDAGLTYEDYLSKGSPGHRRGWDALHEQTSLSKTQAELIGSFTRELNVLVSSGVWCGDCAQQMPVLDHIERASDKITCRFLDRDEHSDFAEKVMLCGGLRVPVVLILNEDYDLLNFAGDRTLSRYRALAARQLGASCTLPGAPVPDDEARATLQDWVDEFERAQLMARLSTKLRQRYSD
ncbi:MAG: hypothetical protein Phyf2KO_09520 [Phycisphaerales bacterium]